ncbi:MAG: UDP-N-acetylmuramoyl-L-alanine--D-glutamate ligase [Deltaproteobacteria bacterium]|nr:MAG: UDP-N-acetylmuramoyl-L-alanine--D-glutamate ligase [Deltaproteobacteria bacterium]
MAPASNLDLSGSAVLVVGMARSGRAAAALARDLGARVTTTDLRHGLPPVEGCRAVHGRHDETDFTGADLVIVSPGVPASAPLLQAARRAGATVVGELGFAAGLLQDLPALCVTGTNGKSSTCHFLGQLLQAAGRRPFVGGNFGVPLSELARRRLGERLDVDVLVLEVSSYQLELPGALRPAAAAVLNLTPDHLGRHGDMAGYAAAKRVLLERSAGPAWLPTDLSAMAAGIRAPVRWLDAHPGVRAVGDRLIFEGVDDDGPVDLSGLPLPGIHNRANVAAACALALSLGIRREQLVVDALTPLAHRLETVGVVDDVRWVNDSKATNVEAALAGIRALPEARLVLLGGEGKPGADYGALRPALAGREVIAFGASGPEIHAVLGGHAAPTLGAAVALARRIARPGDTVLLSPACASFDEFSDFEDRGRRFADLVHHPSTDPALESP